MRQRQGMMGRWPRDGTGAWNLLIEPDAEVAWAVGFPIGVSMCAPLLALWALATPLAESSIGYASLIIAAVMLGPLHELTHAALLPRPAGAPTTIALSLRQLTLAVRCDGVMPRNRWILVLLAPLFVVSLLPLGAAVLLGRADGLLLALSFGNALVSSGDVLAAGLVLAQVPAGAVLCRLGAASVWRLDPRAE